MSESNGLEGKRVLVTGAGRGLGREIALEFARQKASVVLHYSHSSEGMQSAVDEIEAAGGRAKGFAADFNVLDEIRRLAEDALSFLGGIDVLVNNAGITMNLPFSEVVPEQFDTLYRVNVRGQFFLTQAMVGSMVNQRCGSIINVTSIHAFQGVAEHAVYAGTKGAIVAYTRQLAIELAPHGIRVNGIAPGAVPVESHFDAIPSLDIEQFGKLIPIGFAGRPVDIAKIVTFLASEDARYIVGQTLIADGGTTSWMPFSEGYASSFHGAKFGKGYVPGL